MKRFFQFFVKISDFDWTLSGKLLEKFLDGVKPHLIIHFPGAGHISNFSVAEATFDMIIYVMKLGYHIKIAWWGQKKQKTKDKEKQKEMEKDDEKRIQRSDIHHLRVDDMKKVRILSPFQYLNLHPDRVKNLLIPLLPVEFVERAKIEENAENITVTPAENPDLKDDQSDEKEEKKD